MAEGTRRGRLVMYLLLPAIVAAALVVLVYLYRASTQLEHVRQRSVFDATLTLANEKVDRLDHLVIEQDNVIVSEAGIGDPLTVGRRWLPTAVRETPTVRAVLVIGLSAGDAQVLAFSSRAPGLEDESFRRLLVNKMLPDLKLGAPEEQLRHFHKTYAGQSYLVSYWQREVDGRRYLILAWHDVPRLVQDYFRKLFFDPSGIARINVVDEDGRQVFGLPLRVGELTVGKPFPTTLYGWRLQVALTGADELGQQVARSRALELGLVTIACIVIILGVLALLYVVEQERRLSEQKSEFVANVSHELKTPLSLVRMFSELLLTERVSSDAKKKEYLEIIMTESERLTALIENVLDFARVDRGKATFDFAPEDLADVTSRAVEVYRYRAEREGMQVELNAPRGLGEVRLDARAMELSIINLLDNALKYAKEGARVDVRLEAENGFVQVRVTDRGPGIPKEDQKRIFDRFVRGKAARDSRVRGTGIGLALVKHIAEAHGGYVRVESEPGSGATFIVGVPTRPGS